MSRLSLLLLIFYYAVIRAITIAGLHLLSIGADALDSAARHNHALRLVVGQSLSAAATRKIGKAWLKPNVILISDITALSEPSKDLVHQRRP